MIRVTAQQIVAIGVGALPMVLIVACVLGGSLILVIDVGVNLHAEGAGDFLGTVIVVILIRELGPLLTAFVIVARSGSAMCTEVGNLQVGLQIMALRAMGIRILNFIVLPRMLAFVLSMVCLTVYFNLVAVMSGIAVATLACGIPYAALLDGLEHSLGLTDMLIMMVKGGVFGLAISAICCHHGLSVQGAAPHVSLAAVRATETSVMVCVLLDVLMVVIQMVLA